MRKMITKPLNKILFLILAVSFCLNAYGFDEETIKNSQLAVKMADNAISYYNQHGFKKTVAKINNNEPPFKVNEYTYTTLMNDHGIMLAHPAKPYLRNVNLLKFYHTDPQGKKFIEKILYVAKKGGGWVHYHYRKPESKNHRKTHSKYIHPRILYIKPIPGTHLFFTVGFLTTAIH
ncbi:hypothetical protein E3983_03780 [Legionella israelensis]|uniref:Single Cache domain-containing protein n=2 Tax=Legionella israelensis TaxID=454 RepID=A0AAX1EEP9_9GAMM|nr:hypothetical protein E3983_03780 [Legionella israelensis]